MRRTQKLLGMFAATAICSTAIAQTSTNSDRNHIQTQDRTSQNQADQNRNEPNAQNRNRQNTRDQGDRYRQMSETERQRMRRNMQQRMSDTERQRMHREMQRQNANNRGMSQNQRSNQRHDAMNSSKTITGTIRSMKNFNLTGVDGKRSIARVETENGDRVAVILGPTSQVDTFNLSQGDQVTMRVNQGSVDGRNVLVADRVRSGDKTHRVENSKVDNLKRISGQIVSTKTKDLTTGNDKATKHQLIKVKESNGRTCIVSLGPLSDTDQMRLSNGKEVSVLASPTKVNGHTVYCARSISYNGKTKNLASIGSSKDRNQRSNEMNSSKSLTVTIRDMKDFNLTGVDGKRSIARVETENGDRVAVILGPTSQVNTFNLSRGDQVTLRVNQGSVDGRNVLVADRVRSGDKTHQIENNKVDDLKRISGQIVSTKVKDLTTGNDKSIEHQLIKVKESNGRTYIVSLGPLSGTDQMRLSKGKKVSVLASPTKVNGHMVYCARSVSHNGQTKNLASAGSGMSQGATQD